jgi:hypothetical protein
MLAEIMKEWARKESESKDRGNKDETVNVSVIILEVKLMTQSSSTANGAHTECRGNTLHCRLLGFLCFPISMTSTVSTITLINFR